MQVADAIDRIGEGQVRAREAIAEVEDFGCARLGIGQVEKIAGEAPKALRLRLEVPEVIRLGEERDEQQAGAVMAQANESRRAQELGAQNPVICHKTPLSKKSRWASFDRVAKAGGGQPFSPSGTRDATDCRDG
jgi:hypothetical protein